ncbi:MAG: transposase [Tissierellia bacterium]|nr:transposase [Tissierellia bacterium]
MKVNRVEQHLIKKNNPDWKIIDELCFKSKNIYNYANYIIRQVFIITNLLKENKEITQEQSDFLIWVNESVNKYNVNKKINLEKKQEKGKNVDKEFKPLEYFDKDHRSCNYDFMDFITKQSEPFKDLGSNSSQQTLKVLDKNWKSFYESIKDWFKNKEKYLGRPKLPNYKDKEKGRKELILTNVQSKIVDGYIYFAFAPLKPLNNKFQTKVQDKLIQTRFIPRGNTYVMELVYEIEAPDINKENKNIIGIDIGIDNLVSVVNNIKLQPFIINGRPLKSINQYYNKEKSKMQTDLKLKHNMNWSNKLQKLTNKRNNKIDDYIHKTSKMIIDWCLENNIDTVVIGKNKGWKQESSMSKKVNQNFVQIPFAILINKIKYKCENNGINFIETEESYTSGTSFLDGELPIKENYDKSRRITRGLFKSNGGELINADLNGAYQIIHKVFPNAFADGIEGAGLHPVRLNVI